MDLLSGAVEAVFQEGTNLVFAARNHVNDRDSGCVADVRPGILIDDLLRCYLKFSGDVKNISAVEQDRVLVFAALPTFFKANTLPEHFVTLSVERCPFSA